METKDPIKLLRIIRTRGKNDIAGTFAYEYVIPLLPMQYLAEFLASDSVIERRLARKRSTQLTQLQNL